MGSWTQTLINPTWENRLLLAIGHQPSAEGQSGASRSETPRFRFPIPDSRFPIPDQAYSSTGGQAQTRLRSPYALSTRPTAGQNFR